MPMSQTQIPLREKLAYGLGNFMPTAVTATGGLAMYFYTDVAGLSAAFIGTMLLLVRMGDAAWDLFVGRLVDRGRSRWGQCRPFLLFAAPALALALVASFTVPPWAGSGRTVFLVGAYVALWWCYSLVQIPFQSMAAVVAPDPDERLRLSGVNALLQFVFVVACGAGFPILKDLLSNGDPAQGFQRAALVFAGLGLVLTWACFAGVRERVAPAPAMKHDLRADFSALWADSGWRVCVLAFGLQAVLIGLPLAAGVYYFNAVLRMPQMIGPFMGVSGIGLLLGVILSDRLTRRFCKKRVMVLMSLGTGLAALGYLLVGAGQIGPALAVAVLANIMLGATAPIGPSMLADTADAVELASGRRVVGTLFASVNFAQKVGGGAASAIVGLVLGAAHYAAGKAEQTPQALMGITALMSVIPMLLALATAALIGLGYPRGKAELDRLRDALARQRAAAAAVDTELVNDDHRALASPGTGPEPCHS